MLLKHRNLFFFQTWPEGNPQDAFKEEDKTEEETIRRPRGKRRRRLRKRQRNHQVDEIDRTNNPDNGQDNYYARSEFDSEGVTPVEYPRRRPGKRRRRPYRRYQDDENSPPKPLRRRRKGGRKKIRPEIQEEIVPTEIPHESIRNEDNFEIETTTSLPKINPSIDENLTEEKVPITEVNIKSYQTTNQPIIENSNKDLQDRKLISNTVRTEKDEINIEKPTAYGNKIFDRKKLFSNSRRMLPVTSAVIRRLSPNSKTNTSDIPNEQLKTDYVEQVNINTSNITEKNKITTKLQSLPELYAIPTETIRPEKLIEEFRKAEKKQEQNDSTENDTFEGEEPNYPKIIPKPFLNKSKVLETTTHSVTEHIEINQTESPTTSLALIQNRYMEEEFEKMIDNLDLKTLNLTNFNDYILELLKTKSGKDYLSKILESRNMTLAQLLEHREKGSSQFHLFEIFPQKKHIEENTTRITTSIQSTTVTSTTTSSTTPKVTLNIILPSEEVIETLPPKFIPEEIENVEQKIEKEESIESTSTATKENREPRLFESMPEFTTTTVSSAKKEEKPIWRVIPNPKFRPVSVRGKYEEIPVSHILNKPLENNANDIYIVDETETQANKKYSRTSGDGAKKDGFGSFRKIPVGVKSAIIISGIILAMATFGFLSLLISCRVRQKRSLLRAKQDLMCEHLQNEDFMASQQSLSPVLTKHQQAYSHHNHDVHTNPHNRHYYLWRTIRRTFRYD